MIDGLSPSERLEAPSTERLGKRYPSSSLLEVFRASVFVIVSLVPRRCPRRATEQDMRYEHLQERTAVQKQVKRAGIHAVFCGMCMSNAWMYIEAGRLTVCGSLRKE